MDRFTRAYLECALWCSVGEDERPLDEDYGIEDIAPASLDLIAEDCRRFVQDNIIYLEQAGTPDQNGHDFWLTRNHHGAGFWGRGYRADIGKMLTNAAHAWGSSDLYVGDDGKLYIS